MGTATVTVQLSESGWTPGKVCTLLRGCVGRSGVSKALKHLKKTSSALPKVGSTPGCTKLIKNTREKVREIPGEVWGKLALTAGVNCGAM